MRLHARTHARALALTISVLAARSVADVLGGQEPVPPVIGAAPWPGERWPRAEPATQGFDETRLADLVTRVRSGEIRNIHSLLVVRRGRLVLEEYFNGHEADELHTLQSVTKSFTSALVGIAIAADAIRGVDEKVLDFFDTPETFENMDNRKRRLTLGDLLTMRSGTDYHERGPDSPHDRLNAMQSGWTAFILGRPMIAEPGTGFRYDSGAVILTSELLRRRTGLHADAFAKANLFEPLGIERTRWYRNAEGHPHTGGGLDLTSRDMARFGLLYLREGRWRDRQVVPRDWVKASLSRQVRFERPRGGAVGYGYWWWVFPPDPRGAGERDIYAACGFRGQFIVLVPEHDIVVVVTAGCRGRTEERAAQNLYSEVLAARVR